MNQLYSLARLGWGPFFQQQMDLEELDAAFPVRVASVHKSLFPVVSEQGEWILELTGKMAGSDTENHLTVGDWLLVENESRRPLRRLERKSLFMRKSPGVKVDVQLVAANVDTLFVVSSCNQEFNLSRLERYLSLAHEAEVTPVVVLTKADLIADATEFQARTRALSRDLIVLVVNALSEESVACLRPWCGPGQTVALMGSSGVGKSTLLNTLSGGMIQKTREIREEDGKGRHTTTHRSLHMLPDGGLLLDSPGMKELQLTACEDGVNTVFEEVARLAQACRFSNCTHENEPGCALLEALEKDELDLRRFTSYKKLLAEQARNQATLAQRREKDKAFGKMVKSVMKIKKNR